MRPLEIVETPDVDQLLLKGIDPSLKETQEMMQEQIHRKAENEKYLNLARVKEINENYQKINEWIGEVQGETAHSLEKKRAELWAMFDKQLEEFKQRVKLQTMKENEGKRDWEDVEKELTEKLETLTEIAQKIDADNIRLMKKNNELKIEFLSQENDRDLLIQQLLAEKKRYHKI